VKVGGASWGARAQFEKTRGGHLHATMSRAIPCRRYLNGNSFTIMESAESATECPRPPLPTWTRLPSSLSTWSAPWTSMAPSPWGSIAMASWLRSGTHLFTSPHLSEGDISGSSMMTKRCHQPSISHKSRTRTQWLVDAASSSSAGWSEKKDSTNCEFVYVCKERRKERKKIFPSGLIGCVLKIP